jgi:glutamate--cysteine ligase
MVTLGMNQANLTNLIQKSLATVSSQRLMGMRRGIEKESLRALSTCGIALTPHPKALGSALTHPSITTDYCESQLELITSAHLRVEDCVDELMQTHQFVYRSLLDHGDEMMWVSSMPCGLPTDETIPISRYGNSNVGKAKSVYRMGLGHRYGRRMQTISGIHYNWSLPEVSTDQYFDLIRNFRRNAFLLLYLFGASPALCPSFVEGRDHGLQQLDKQALYLPHATSLRMGPLGYQSDAQATLAVSYNGLDGYAASLFDALSRPYPAYEQLGVRNPGGEYIQLSTTLLQIENEFYGTIRPKRTIRTGERPLHALRERGVEYIEVRLMDLDPFEIVGINASTMRFLDVFLMHCLLTPSAPDSPAEIEELKYNQHNTAARGREPGLNLKREGSEIALTTWGREILDQCAPIAASLDAAHQTHEHSQALQTAIERINNPALTPSARVLEAMQNKHSNSFVQFVQSQSIKSRDALLGLPWSAEQQQHFEQLSAQSVLDQRAIEDADHIDFETFRQQYMSTDSLNT